MDADLEYPQEPDEPYDDTDYGELGGQSPDKEPDVFLDVPQVKVDEIDLEVEDLRVRVALSAEVLNLLRLNVGADAALGRVHLGIKGVEAQALLKVRLDNVAAILGRVLATIDHNPQILEQLTSGLGAAAQEVGHGAEESLKELGHGAEAAVGEVGKGAGQAVGEVGKGVGEVGKGAGQTVGEVGKGVGEAGKGAGQAVGKIGEGAGQTVGEAGKGAGEAAESVGKALGTSGRAVKKTGTQGRAVKKTPGGTGAAKQATGERKSRPERGGGATPRRAAHRREQERGPGERPP